MNKPYISYTNRSAHIDRDKYVIYYGPDEVDELTGDYCFVAWKGDREVARYTNAQLLELANGEGLKDLIIAGLVMMLK